MKKSSKKKRKPKKHIKLLKIVIFFIILLSIVAVSLFLIEDNTIKNFTNKEEITIELTDECSLLFNNIIHRIKTEGNCESLCKIECKSQDLDFKSSEFTQNQTACNSCTCNCR